MSKILLASNNKHKAEEFKQIFIDAGLSSSLVLPQDLYLGGLEVEETGLTFEENAEIKALAFNKAAGMPVISDDSGLEVDCLGLKPGVTSARYAGVHGDDAANRKKVLDEVLAKDCGNLKARFRCVICYFDGNEIIQGVGKVEGRISLSERGSGGFGYDPIFIPDGYESTFAELPAEIKNQISHRKRALDDFIEKYKTKN
ncbi:MAG: RdgB/HAM1 family non-canonical purine NTP pyrophosphatase [Candidatus Kapabacteria bacterium]|nr:RdgB/HAM1 family non-canonical purine NTP pyrophosphatase [Ignavibacteriota bacterium]MCW5885294.1 RdgB/HAM1 family non-canonical purine NTP pyrophosphatase [Candidatus Kapabacteria bacterium]